MATEVSIIVPVWNGRAYLKRCLTAVLAQEGDFEVIAVDDGSTDGSPELVARAFPQVHLLRHDANQGFGASVNTGMRAARGQILVWLNQDTVVEPGWLVALLDGLRFSPEVGIAGCKILSSDNKTIQHAGGAVEYPTAFTRHLGRGEPDQRQYNELREVEYVTGAALAVKREVIERVGLLDEDFSPAYFEDVDFCFRARRRGYRVIYQPDAMLIHYESTSIQPGSYAQYGSFHRGRVRFVLKTFEFRQLSGDFLPAEKAAIAADISFESIVARSHAYLANLLALPDILVLRAEEGSTDATASQAVRRELVGALVSLRQRAVAVMRRRTGG